MLLAFKNYFTTELIENVCNFQGGFKRREDVELICRAKGETFDTKYTIAKLKFALHRR